MRTRVFSVLLATLLLVGASAAHATSGERGDGKGKGKSPSTIVLYAEETAATYVTADGTVFTGDLEEAVELLPSAGDRFMLVDTLYSDAARTEAVGRNDIVCTVTEFTGTDETDFSQHLYCAGVVTVSGAGSLSWQGAVHFSAADEFDPDSPFITVAVTGGTGDFRGASGEVALFDESEDDDESLTRYEVSLDRRR